MRVRLCGHRFSLWSLATLGFLAGSFSPAAGHGRVVLPSSEQAANLEESDQLTQFAEKALDAGDYVAAEDNIKKAIVLAPPSNAYQILTEALYAQGKDEEALRAYKQINRPEDGSPAVALRYAALLVRSGQWSQALAIYSRETPQFTERFGLNDHLMETNCHFTTSLPQPKELEAAINIGLGIVEFQFSSSPPASLNNRKALTDIGAALRIEPSSGLANYYYGQVLERSGHKAEAQSAYLKACESEESDVKLAAKKALIALTK